MEPKPLTKERREEIEALLFDSEWTRLHPILQGAIRDLLAAEAYWREAVKNCSAFAMRAGFCVFCGGFSMEGHKPGCPAIAMERLKRAHLEMK